MTLLSNVEAIVNQIVANKWMSKQDAMVGVLNQLGTKDLVDLYLAIPKRVNETKPKLNRSFRVIMVNDIVEYFVP